MISSRLGSCSLAAAVLFAATLSTAASAGEQGASARIGDRCDMYGPGFMDLGNGTCGRIVINGRVRVDGAQSSAAYAWPSTGSTQTTGLRTDSAGMVPGAGDAQHLRIQNGAYSYGR